MNDWRRANEEQHERWHQHWRVIKWHPLTWLIIMVAIAYIFEL